MQYNFIFSFHIIHSRLLVYFIYSLWAVNSRVWGNFILKLYGDKIYYILRNDFQIGLRRILFERTAQVLGQLSTRPSDRIHHITERHRNNWIMRKQQRSTLYVNYYNKITITPKVIIMTIWRIMYSLLVKPSRINHKKKYTLVLYF